MLIEKIISMFFLRDYTAVFTAGKNEYYLISNRVIEIAKKGENILEQNPGY